MEEEITIINTKTRNEKIRSFLLKNKKFIIVFIFFLIIMILGFYSYQVYQDKQREQFSDKYNSSIIDFRKVDESQTISSMKEIIQYKDEIYSPLALFFLLDNNLLNKQKEANNLFNILINETNLDKEIRNLIIYKKSLFNADTLKENELLDMLKPITQSDSVWKSHALYLIGEYFYFKNEKKKSKEFFEKIFTIKNANEDIVLAAQKRLNRDLSE